MGGFLSGHPIVSASMSLELARSAMYNAEFPGTGLAGWKRWCEAGFPLLSAPLGRNPVTPARTVVCSNPFQPAYRVFTVYVACFSFAPC
ncbi:hypothetical protein FA15DRAFT_445717 [Coprinopsis marcescibilis]|uniref:Uncharacterized protein n=1 Tax=Coprinopsis marcescibilis TaxID=230819 RepID=A0A5C3KTE4_COPMA|nr:hypothetical protein FA15DRAFT_445717 [Coprinopsis marcescibilis]